MNRELYFTLLLFAATLLAIWGFLLVLSPFLPSIAWALCLAAMTYPLYLRLRRRLKRSGLTALVMVVATALLILLPLAVVVIYAGEEVIRLGKTGLGAGVSELKEAVPSFYEWLNVQLKEWGMTRGIDDLVARMGEAAPAIIWGPLARGAWEVLGAVFTTIMSLVIMFATQYFVYTEAPRLSGWVRSLLPLSSEDTSRVFSTLRTTTSAAVMGGVLVAVIQGALGGVGYVIAGIQAPVLWGLVTAFFSLLPVGGSALVWGPMVIYLFVTGHTSMAWFLLAWGGIVVGGVDNFLRPWILRRTGSRVHAMLLFFAILSGIGLFGMSGIVFGPLLIAVLVTLTQIYREYMSRTKPPDGAEAPPADASDVA